MLICGRCSKTTDTVRDMERHLAEDHLMGGAQAKQEARQCAETPVTNPDLGDQHQCPKCGATIECDWRTIGLLEEQARRMKIIAGMWRAKLAGTHVGRPRQKEFDEAEARALIQAGLSIRGVARQLGTNSTTVSHALKRTASSMTPPQAMRG